MLRGRKRWALAVKQIGLFGAAFVMLAFPPLPQSPAFSVKSARGRTALASGQPQSVESDFSRDPVEMNWVRDELLFPAGRYDVAVTIGDHSGSASEQWKIYVGPAEVTAPLGELITEMIRVTGQRVFS